MASEKILDRIRKLLALTESPNPHEAESARETADALLTKHGLTRADFEEHVVIEIDDERDELRQRLAVAVSVSRRCSVVAKKSRMAFKGRQTDVENGRELYRTLTLSVAQNCNIGPRDPGRELWRLQYWTGFVDTVIERLIDDEARSWMQQPATAKKPNRRPAPVEPDADPLPTVPIKIQIDRATHEFAQVLQRDYGVDWFRRDAYAAGRALANSANIEPYKNRTSNARALGAKEES